MTEARGQQQHDNNTTSALSLLSENIKETTRAAYLHQHLEAGDPLKGQDEEGGQREPLADGVLFQAGQDAREPRVFLPIGQAKAKNNKTA